MADWETYVRLRLSLEGLKPERQAEIVEDVARQLDEACRDARRTGASEADARAAAERHVADWAVLSAQLTTTSRGRLSPADRWSGRADDRLAGSGRPPGLLSHVRQDVVYAWRTMWHGRGVAAVAILSLALGIGANTAIFSVINALMFRPLPIAHPETLVALTDPTSAGMMTGIETGERSLLSYHEYEGLCDGRGVLSTVAAFSSQSFLAQTATGDGDDDARAAVVLATGTFFPLVGVEPQMGRLFGPEVDRGRMDAPVAVVSRAFWLRRLGASPTAVGRAVRIRNTTFNVIGVLPASFTGLVVGDAPDVFIPVTMQRAVAPTAEWLTQDPATPGRTMFLHVVARLNADVSLATAQTTMNSAFKRDLDADARMVADGERRKALLDASITVRFVPHGLSTLRSDYQEPLGVLMALVGLLLLLACANVANLLLARATARRREFAVRVALGAARARLVVQLLTESLVLASVGAAVGVWLGQFGIDMLLRLVSTDPGPVPLDAGLDGVVLAFTAGLTVVTGVLFGLAPALRSARVDLNTVLRESSATVAGAARGRGRWPVAKTLAIVQVALSLILLVTAGLFVRSLQKLGDVPLGYDPSRILTFSLDPRGAGYTSATIKPFYQDFVARLTTIPGVEKVSFSENGLFYGGDSSDEVSFPDDVPGGAEPEGHFDNVAPGYFAAIGVPVLLGRDVDVHDGDGGPACWLGQTMRQKYFQSRNPVGHRMVVHYSAGDSTCEIRGVVADARTNNLRSEIAPRFYVSFFGAFTKPTRAVMLLRLAKDAAVTADVRRMFHERLPRLPNPIYVTVAELVDRRLSGDRLTARLSTLFGALGVVMAAIGLYGILSYSVSRRVNEIGVRMALGADRTRILGLIAREAGAIAGLGTVAGIGGALAATRLLKALLFQLSPRDPLTLALAVGVVVLVSAAATALPALRASKTSPIVALRSE